MGCWERKDRCKEFIAQGFAGDVSSIQGLNGDSFLKHNLECKMGESYYLNK